MTWRADEATCGRTARIGEAVLDGAELAPTDRVHLAGCAACGREADRASSFVGRLALAAEWAMDDVPDAMTDAAARPLRSLRRALASGAMLAGAVAAGLLLAAVVGLRLSAPTGIAGEPRIGGDGGGRTGGDGPRLRAHRWRRHVRIRRTRPRPPRAAHRGGRRHPRRGGGDHRHDGPGDRPARGRRSAEADDDRGARSAPHGAAATAWLADTYAGCEGTCSADVAGMHLELERRDDAAILTIEAR